MSQPQVLAGYDLAGEEKVSYTYGIDRIGSEDTAYLYDGRGSVSETLTADGLISEYSYDPYGALVSRNTYDYDSAVAGRYDLAEEELFMRYDEGLARDSEGNIVPGGVSENFVGFAFNGEEQSQRTGLQYLRARYYDSSSGSFISMDSYEGSIMSPLSQNRYTYAENDPVNNFDPSGHAAASSKGIERYVDSSDINELRAFMQGAAMYQGARAASENFYGNLMSAQATSFMNYGSISGISKSTANYYIEQGIRQAAELSLNYGCSKPAVSDEAAARYASDVNRTQETINDKIEQIKANKKTQYEGYQTYLRQSRENPASPYYMNYMSFALNYLGIAAFGILSAVNGKLANKKLESTLSQMMDIKDVRNMSSWERINFVDTIAAILISVLPNMTYEIGRPYKVPIQGGYIYYGTNVNGTLRAGAESSVNVIMESERNKFKDFLASVGIGGYQTTVSKDTITITGTSQLGTSSAGLSININVLSGKASAEYISTVNAQGNISLTTILGFEKDMGRDTWRNLQNSFDNIVDTVTDSVTSFAKNVVQGIKDIFSNPLSAVAIIGGLLIFKTPVFA